jgi:hypothetical protein
MVTARYQVKKKKKQQQQPAAVAVTFKDQLGHLKMAN